MLAVPLLWAAATRAEGAPPAPRAGGVDEASAPLIAEMLRKTEAQREARVRERLDAYYVKNFKGKKCCVAGYSCPRNLRILRPKLRRRLHLLSLPAPLPLRADYFGSGFGRAGTSPETQAAIDAWMEKNAPEKK